MIRCVVGPGATAGSACPSTSRTGSTPRIELVMKTSSAAYRSSALISPSSNGIPPCWHSSSTLRRVIPAERLRVTNQVGLAYGFTVENAYVEDVETGRSFFLAGTLYTNANGVLNDGVYEYDTLALPFWADLGEALARELLLEPGDR